MELDAARAFLGAPPEDQSSLAGVSAGGEIPTAPDNGTDWMSSPDLLTGSALAPQTHSALQDTIPSLQTNPADIAVQSLSESRKAEYQAKNAIPGIELDTGTGASPWERFVLSFAREKKNQVAYLQKQYGEENVRQDTEGGLIFRVLDTKTGKPKDVKLNEDTMSAKDFIDLAGSMPEVAAGIMSIRAGRGIPGLVGKLKGLMGLQRDVIAGALGAETAGAVKDIAAGLAMKGSEDVGDVLKERGKMALADVAIGEATMGLGRVAKFMESPLAGSRGPVQFDAIAAQKYFKDKYGIDVPLSIGESTGSPLISRTETFMEKLPGGGTPFKALKGQQEEKLRELQGIMMGQTPASDEVVGKQLIDKINSTLAPAKEAVLTGKEALAKTGTQGIEDVVTGLTMPERQLLKSDTGASVRTAVVAKRDAAKAEADRLYGIVDSLPGGQGKVFDGTDLQKSLQGILDKLPSPESMTQVPTGILGPTGAPVMRTQTGKEVLKEFVPPNVLARLRAVTDLKDPQFSLSDLQQMRREVYDDIAKGEGVPGLGTHYLNDVGKALTSAIDKGASSLPTSDLKNALQAANAHYKDVVVPFNRIGLTELFRAPDEAGAISNSEVISRLFGGGKAVQNYQILKETLTPASPEFTKVKRAIADNLLERSRYPGGEFIDPESFINNVSSFTRDYKEIADDIFGTQANKMMRMAKAMTIGGLTPEERTAAGIAGTPKVSSAEFASLLTDPNPTSGKLRALIMAEAKRDDLYKNDLMRAVGKGELPDKTLDPEEFVNRFVSQSTPSDVKKVMDLLGRPTALTNATDPLLADIRAKVVEKVFRDAGRSATPGDLGKLMIGDPTRIMSATSLYKEIGEPGMKEKLLDILGPDTYKDLEQYINILKAGEMKEGSFKAAGGLAAGMQIAQLTRSGPLKYMYSAGKDWMVASLLTRQPLRGWLSSVPVSSDPGAISLLLTSPPFIKAVTDEFGTGPSANAFMAQIKQSIDKWTKEDAPKQAPAPPTDFEQRQKMMRDYLHR